MPRKPTEQDAADAKEYAADPAYVVLVDTWGADPGTVIPLPAQPGQVIRTPQPSYAKGHVARGSDLAKSHDVAFALAHGVVRALSWEEWQLVDAGLPLPAEWTQPPHVVPPMHGALG